MAASDAIHPEQLALFDATKLPRSSKPTQSSGFELTPTTMPAPRDRMASPLEHPQNQMQLLVNPTEHIKRISNSTDLPYAYGESQASVNRMLADTKRPDPSGASPNAAMARLWSGKELEARDPEGRGHGSGLYDKLKGGEQFHTPIQTMMQDIGNPDQDWQREGHHRVAAGAALERERGEKGRGSVWMPMEYTGDVGGKHGTHNMYRDEIAAHQSPTAGKRRSKARQAREARNRANMNDLA